MSEAIPEKYPAATSIRKFNRRLTELRDGYIRFYDGVEGFFRAMEAIGELGSFASQPNQTPPVEILPLPKVDPKNRAGRKANTVRNSRIMKLHSQGMKPAEIKKRLGNDYTVGIIKGVIRRGSK